MSNSGINQAASRLAQHILPVLRAKSNDFKEADAKRMAEIILRGIGFTGDTFRLVPNLSVYIGGDKEVDLARPDKIVQLPQITTCIPVDVGDFFGLDQEINARWPMVVIRKIARVYEGVIVIFAGVTVASKEEMDELVKLVSLRIGSSAQEESLPSHAPSGDAPCSTGTAPAP